jgi:uncharacterized membrane protein YqjE
MDTPPPGFAQLNATARDVARTLLTIGSNRLELLRVEVQEERVLLLQSIFLAFGAAAFGLLCGVTLTGMVVFLFYNTAPVTVMAALLILYGAAAVMIHRRLSGLLREWRNLPSTFDQLRKDRICLETIFE